VSSGGRDEDGVRGGVTAEGARNVGEEDGG